MSKCSHYIARPTDPANRYYGVIQQCCGSCARWDQEKEKCKNEEVLRGGQAAPRRL